MEEVDREAGVTAAAPSSSSLMSSSMELSLRRVGSRAALHLLPGLQVARSARAMLLGVKGHIWPHVKGPAAAVAASAGGATAHHRSMTVGACLVKVYSVALGPQ